MGRSRKPLSAQALRGFESPSLRHFNNCAFAGDVAQLGEHLVRNEGVGGSSPLISTKQQGWLRSNPTTGAAAKRQLLHRGYVGAARNSKEIVLDGELAVPSNPAIRYSGVEIPPEDDWCRILFLWK